MAGELRAVDREDRRLEPLALLAEPRHGGRPLRAGQVVGRRERHGPGDVLRAGPAVALLLAPVLLGEDVRPVAHVQHADALRAFELVRGDRDEVRPERTNVDLDVGRGLDRVDVEQDAAMAAHLLGDLGDRLDGADLVVGEHDRDEDRAVVDRRVELVGIDPRVPVDGQLDDLEPELLEVAQGVADRVVLDGRGDDPVAATLAGPRPTLEGKIVRLGAARREDDLAGLGVQARGDPLVRLVERRARGAAERMGRARVAERARQERLHRLEDLRANRRRRGVVEVDRHPGDATPPASGRPYEASTRKSLPSIVTA